MRMIQLVIGVALALVVSALAVAYSLGAFHGSKVADIDVVPGSSGVVEEGGVYYFLGEFNIHNYLDKPLVLDSMYIDGVVVPVNDNFLIKWKGNEYRYDAFKSSFVISPKTKEQIVLKISFSDSSLVDFVSDGEHTFKVILVDSFGKRYYATTNYVVKVK